MNGKTDIPLVQVSLPGDGSPESTAFLGRALKKLREEGYALIGTGQIVHNLRDVCKFLPLAR
jgi:aromatic ring-opening dioxygenase catalytic subunit (LigB family)